MRLTGKSQAARIVMRAHLDAGGTVQYCSSNLTFAMHMSNPSTRMWLRMMETGNYDRRRMKRMMRLIAEGR
jgi:uncharacterized protein YaeQ